MARLSILLSILVLSLVSAPSASALPEKFFGLHWAPTQGASDMEAVARSGAKYYHVQISQTTNVAAAYDPIFQLAYERGVTILPILYSGGPTGRQFPTLEQLEKEGNGPGTWIYFIYDVVHRYGFQGDFWAGKSNPRPVPAWEVWNEPNFRENNPGGASVYPESYTRFARRTAVAIQDAQKQKSGFGTRVNFGNLFSAKTCKDGATCEEGSNYKSMNVGLFLEKAANVDPGGANFTGLALHPYSFSGVGGVQTNVNFAREKLNQFFGGSTKELWITELGWQVGVTDPAHERVTPEQQAQYLTESFNWVRSVQAAKNIQSLIYYNYRDFGGVWDGYAGLRSLDGSFRPAWWEFQKQTGASAWPVPSPQVRVSFADASNANTVSYWTYGSDTGWQQTFLWGHPVAAGTRPAMLTFNGTLHIFYVDASRGNQISEWSWLPSGGWQQNFLETDPVASGSSPSAIMVNGTPQIYFADAATNRSITALVYNGSGWQQSRFYGDSVAANSSPSAISNNGTPQVYFADASKGNTIAVWTWGSTLQQSFFYGDSVAANSSPSAISNNGTPQVYFADASKGNTIAVWTWGSTLQQSFFYGDSVAANSSPSAILNGGTVRIYFADASTTNSMALWEWGSSLQQLRLFGHPVASGASPGA